MNVMNEELLDLLTGRALGQLSRKDDARLEELLDEAGLTDSDDVELAVAAAMNAFAGKEATADDTSASDSLRQKLLADANRFFDGRTTPRPVSDIGSAMRQRNTDASTGGAGPSWIVRSGWAVAAVLAVVVAIGLEPGAGPQDLSPAEAREALMAKADTAVLEWNRSTIPAYGHVTGDVVWNDETQQGYLRLTGMPANDPSISQYQLWIVDPDRDANPVDGGVFNVPAGAAEVVIPITAKLDVSDPDAFAITREQPGGVVVSDGPLLIVAAS